MARPAPEIGYGRDWWASLSDLEGRDARQVNDAMRMFCENPAAPGLNREMLYGELAVTAWDLSALAADLGYSVESYRWESARRELLRAELDALFFRLYGIGRDDVDYMMDTLPIVRRKDEAARGEYRTALAEAIAAGVPYQTVLDPPPADPRCAHQAATPI